MKKMLIALFALLAIAGNVLAGCGCCGGCGPESGCCGAEKQACTLVKGTGQVEAAGRWQCAGDCNCCGQASRAVVKYA